jgi:OPA family glycerol-3-phosphate transporter-like MFS transporter
MLARLMTDLPPGFRQRRALNWILAGSMYAFFYMARYNFTAITGHLSAVFGWSNTDVGYFESAGPLVYGISVFMNGPLADRIGGRRAILIGAAGSAFFNLLFGFGYLLIATPAVWEGADKAKHVVTPALLNYGIGPSAALGILVAIWAVNFYFQSFGALSIVKINASWFQLEERGFFSGIFGILIRAGLLLAFSGSPFILASLPWQWVFWVPAIALVVLFALNFAFVRDTPADAGFPTIEIEDPSAQGGEHPGLVGVLKKVFANPTMWIIALGSMMIGFVRKSVIDAWYPKYFADVFHIAGKTGQAKSPPYQLAAVGIAVAGIIGGLLFGSISDRVFKGRRAPVVVVGFIGMAILLTVMGFAGRGDAGPYSIALCLVGISFFCNGSHGMIGGAASMDFGGKKAAATAAGLFDGVQYLAGAIIALSLGRLIDAYGWSVWPFVPIPFAIIGALVMRTLWNAMPGASAHGGAPKPAAERAADAA